MPNKSRLYTVGGAGGGGAGAGKTPVLLFCAWRSGTTSASTDDGTTQMWPGAMTIPNPQNVYTPGIPVPRAGVLKNLYVRQDSPGTGTQNYSYTVHVNGVPTALEVADIPVTGTGGSDTVNSVAVSAGDIVSVELVLAGGPSTLGASQITATMELD